MKSKISTDVERKIVDDFAKEISVRKDSGAKPEHTVIEFRNDRKVGKIRSIYLVPIQLLRFRKDNGRIASEVLSYETMNGILDETNPDDQNIIRKFLKEKDEINNEKLKKSIMHSGQNEPAIITCDGFLINGNRRKMVLEELKIETMKVVILPGKGEEGGPPTIKEIEQIENRYQLQSDGKSEYTNFDRAISIKRKIMAGISLEEQLRDDPSLVNMTDKEFKKEIQIYQDKFLGPLECVDRYLEQLRRSGLYDSISAGRSDREGRWYSFIDYYSFYKKLRDDNGELTEKAMEWGIEDDETGEIENVAFKIIRAKDFPNIKTHEVIRNIPKIFSSDIKQARRELMKIKNIPDELEKSEYNESDKPDDIDKKWANKHLNLITGKVKASINIIEREIEQETPLTLLEDALKKLNHEKMDPESLELSRIKEAMKLTSEIQKVANNLEHQFYDLEKQFKKLINKK